MNTSSIKGDYKKSNCVSKYGFFSSHGVLNLSKYVLLLLFICGGVSLQIQPAQAQPLEQSAIEITLPSERMPLTGPIADSAQAHIPPDHLIEAGDIYLLEDGQEVHLLRTEDEIAVCYTEPVTPQQGLRDFEQSYPDVRFDRVALVSLPTKGNIDILRLSAKNAGKLTLPDIKSIAAKPFLRYAYHVLVDPISNCRMIPTDEIMIRLDEQTDLSTLQGRISAVGCEVVREVGNRRMRMYLLRVTNPKNTNSFEVSSLMGTEKGILWAAPNFIREVQLEMIPNDPLFSKQQDKHNTGQNGGTNDADVDAPEAWDITTPNSSVVIAIIDTGVDTSHADLNIDPNGWDFVGGDNNPNPGTGPNAAHGTCCAGVAAAVGNNAYRVAGITFGSKILPIKVFDDSGNWVSDDILAAGISYATDHADVLSNSWGGGSPNPVINAAIDDAVTNGRGGKGCPVFFASGNYASTWNYGGGRFRLSTAGLSGSYYIGFFYYRGPATGGENAVRIDDVCLLDSDGYTHKTSVLPRQNFEGTFPPSGWWLARGGGAGADWSRSSTNPKTGTGGSYSAKSPSLSNNQYAWLFTPLLTISGNETLAFDCSISMGSNSQFYIDVYDAAYIYVGSWGPVNGFVPSISSAIAYPAAYTNSIAVGASTDCDRRSDYSQYGYDTYGYGTRLDFVAPSNGGWNDITTLDPTGSSGRTSTDYTMDFGGTSSACPLAAGVAGLMLSKNPYLTINDVCTIMQNTCDEIGGVSYPDGWNQYYGYGRVNAAAALTAAPQVRTLTISSTAGGHTEPNAGMHQYSDGTAVDINAMPDLHYYFVNWTGDTGTIGNVNAPVTTITMDANYAIWANFDAVMPMDLNDDGIVNFGDFAIFASYWMDDTCSDPDWCEGGDSDHRGRVDSVDLLNFVDYWLWGWDDLDSDGDVDLVDYTVFANQ